MSLNQEINAEYYSILGAFNKESNYCNNALQSTAFAPCNQADLWYHNLIESMLYGKSGINSFTSNPRAYFISDIKDPFNIIFNAIKNNVYSGIVTYGFVSNTTNYDKIYFAKKDSREIRLIQEQIKDEKYMSATYNNFNTNVCDAVSNYLGLNQLQFQLNCNKITGDTNQYVVTGGTGANYYNLFDDLGPKLRIK